MSLDERRELGQKLEGRQGSDGFGVVLAWRIPRTEEPGGLLSMGSHRVGHD